MRTDSLSDRVSASTHRTLTSLSSSHGFGIGDSDGKTASSERQHQKNPTSQSLLATFNQALERLAAGMTLQKMSPKMKSPD